MEPTRDVTRPVGVVLKPTQDTHRSPLRRCEEVGMNVANWAVIGSA